MKTTVWTHESGLELTLYAGPGRSDGGSRTRYQLTIINSGPFLRETNRQTVTLSHEQWHALAPRLIGGTTYLPNGSGQYDEGPSVFGSNRDA